MGTFLFLRTIVNNINESKGVHKNIMFMELRGGVSFTLQRSCFTSMKMSWALASNVGTPRNYIYTDILIYCIYRHMYMYAYLHPYIHAYVLTYMHTYVRTYTLTYASRWISTLLYEDLLTCICWYVEWTGRIWGAHVAFLIWLHHASPIFVILDSFAMKTHVMSPLGILMRKARFVLKWGQVMCWKFTLLLGYNGQSRVSRTNSSWVSRRNLTRTTSQTPLGSLRSPIRNATRVLQSHVAVESSQVPKITEVCLFTKDLPAWNWTFFLKKTFGNRLLILWCLTWSLKIEGLKEKRVLNKYFSLVYPSLRGKPHAQWEIGWSKSRMLQMSLPFQISSFSTELPSLNAIPQPGPRRATSMELMVRRKLRW